MLCINDVHEVTEMHDQLQISMHRKIVVKELLRHKSSRLLNLKKSGYSMHTIF